MKTKPSPRSHNDRTNLGVMKQKTQEPINPSDIDDLLSLAKHTKPAAIQIQLTITDQDGRVTTSTVNQTQRQATLKSYRHTDDPLADYTNYLKVTIALMKIGEPPTQRRIHHLNAKASLASRKEVWTRKSLENLLERASLGKASLEEKEE